MQTLTHDLHLNAAPELVFAYLADLRNMPRWATNFCTGLQEANGVTRIQTPAGPLAFALAADPRTGVIDFIGGPSAAVVTRWHSRVIPAPEGGSIFLFTSIRQPGQALEEFQAQCEMLQHEFANIRAAFDGG